MKSIYQQKRLFADKILEAMNVNKKIIVLTGDLGYKMWDNLRLAHPKRFINVGAAEQALVDIAVGMALEGMIPIVYSITPFLLFRPFESIRIYLNEERIPVKLIGGGRDKDYSHDGFTHWATEDKAIMKLLPNIKSHWPNNDSELEMVIEKMINISKPFYVNLKR